MVDVNSTVCYLRTDIWTWGKDTIILPTPQWGSNPKVKYIPLMVESVAFQSPQWGSNPKGSSIQEEAFKALFQSPQWGSNPKAREVAVFLQ